MKIVRVSTLLALTVAVATGAVLFSTSQKVQRAERHLAALEAEKHGEQESMRVLRAEWDYLNRPDRLESLASRYLGMKQPDLASVTTDARRLNAPLLAGQPALRPIPPSITQPAVYHPDTLPPPVSSSDQQSFQTMIRQLSNGEDHP